MSIPGAKWRILSKDSNGHTAHEMKNVGILDELVIDNWFHIEQMDDNTWWMRIGDGGDGTHVLWIKIDESGQYNIEHAINP